MTSNFDLDHVEGLRAKVDGKAANLFRKRAGEAPLYVNQISLNNGERDEKTARCVQNQAVESLSEIEDLRKVAIPLQSHAERCRIEPEQGK